MPTTTQAQIDEALKKGFSQSQIDSLMKKQGATIAPTSTAPTPTVSTPIPTSPTGNTPNVHYNPDGTVVTPNNDKRAGTTAPSTGGITPTPTGTGTTTTPGQPKGYLTIDDITDPRLKDFLNDPNNAVARGQFDLAARAGKEQVDKFLADSNKNFEEWQKQKDFTSNSADIQREISGISQAAQKRGAEMGLDRATDNSYYSSGSSAKSNAQGGAIESRLGEMRTQIEEMAQIDQLQNKAFNQSVAENLRRLEENFRRDQSAILWDKLKEIDNIIGSGKIASKEQMDNIYKEFSTQILTEIPALNNFTMQQANQLMQNFSTAQKEMRDEALTFMQNSNVYNEEMSKAKGFAIDGNGSPILDVNGKQIEVPKDSWMPVTLSKDGTHMLIGKIDEFGNEFIDKVATGQKAASEGTWQKLNDTTLYNTATGEEKPMKGSTSSSGVIGYESVPFDPPTEIKSRTAGNIAVAQTEVGIRIEAPVGTVLGECGFFANDYAKNLPGYKWVVNDWASKLANDNSDVPVAGGLFMYNPSKSPTEKYGHIGIVESVNADGSFVAYDSNINGDKKSNRRTIKPGDDEYNLIENDGGFFDPGMQETDLSAEVLGLTQGLGGTADERKEIQQQIIKKAQKDGITLAAAKKELGYKSGDDTEFAETRKEEYVTLKKSTTDQTKQAKGTLALLDQPQTAVGDVATIVGFLKTIDPSSVARESEVASVESARSVLDSLSVKLAKLAEGTKLSKEQRAQIKDSIQIIVNAAQNKYDSEVAGMIQEFNERGLDATVYIPKAEVKRLKNYQQKENTGTGDPVQDTIYKLAETMSPEQIIDLMKKSEKTKYLDFSKYNFKLK